MQYIGFEKGSSGDYRISPAQFWQKLKKPSSGSYDFVNGEAEPYNAGGTAFRTYVASRIKATANARAPVIHSLGTDAGYASFVSNTGGVEPKPVTYEFEERSSPNPSPGWKNRRKALTMHVSSYFHSSVHVTCYPARVQTNQSYERVGYVLAKHVAGVFDLVSGRRYYILYGGSYYYLDENQGIWYGDLFRFTVQWTLPPTPPISPAEFITRLSASRELSTALVTETLADANANAVDVLTAAAEMPDTIRELFTAMREVPRLINDVKKRKLSVTKSYEQRKLSLMQRYDERIRQINSTIRKPGVKAKVIRAQEKKLSEQLKLRQRDLDRAAAEFGTALADIWMWMRYSLQPNLYLIDDAIDALNALHAAFDTNRNREDYAFDPKIAISGWSAKPEINRIERVMIKRKYVIDTVASRDFTQVMSANLATTAWELLSRSFVVDWFINVGDYLTATMPTDLDYLDEVATYSWKDTGKVTYTHTNGSSVVYSVESYKRNPFNPSYETGLSFQPALNVFRAIDSVAMLWPSVRNTLMKR